MVRSFASWRSLRQVLADVASWSVAVAVATTMRFEFDLGAVDWSGVATVALLAGAIHMVSGAYVGLYAGRWRFGSFDEVVHLVRAVAITSVTLAVLDRFVLDHLVPVSATLGGGIIALTLMAGTRYWWRLWLERQRRPRLEDCHRLVVIGAGEAGVQIVTAMLTDPHSPYYPVAFLDDDPSLANLSVKGVSVEGTLDDLHQVVKRHDADGLLIAIPSATSELVRRITSAASEIGIPAAVLPSVGELVDGSVGIGDIREVSEADLLGRRQVDLDIESIAHYITGKRVLVTGAGGSIGSELSRQLHHFDPDELILLDRDESALHAVQLSIEGRALLDTPNLVVACVRDRERMFEAFAQWRPHVVFHAAALKHLPLLELHPEEAVKTNVFGTLNVLEASHAVDVETFVNVSTDKAADPTSALGYTKRIAERLTAHVDGTATGSYVSVRFGNVLGSRGSVIDAFRQQIANGGPVTITHPDVTRYFMTVEEASQLVIQAGALSAGGEVLVLDMGEPVRITELAQRMIEHAGRHIDIEFTGLRAGEKLIESLFDKDEIAAQRHHPLIFHVLVEPIEPANLRPLNTSYSADLLRAVASLVRSGPDVSTLVSEP